ncbi:MAG TPA: DoxX family protein [Gammaproteobacteria bacterium]|nr:DoxX family protein [Gammaproteobacteria bacterium]
MTNNSPDPAWAAAAVLIGRLIFAGIFFMALAFKLTNISGTASYIAAAGFPFPALLTWLAALLELVLAVCLLTGAFFSEAALLAAGYILFLAFAFHGPSHWSGNQTEFGFFVDHFTFIAGLMFAAAHGPGARLAMSYGRLGQRRSPRTG